MREKRLVAHTFGKCLVFILFSLVLWGAPLWVKAATVKNVILMIPDGCSFEQYTLARWVKGAPLAMDAILVGAVKTHIADSVVADSAPAASAYATGVRTSDKFISIAPRRKGRISPLKASPPVAPYRPLATVLEAARLSGRAVGVVSTSSVTHATPAAFFAHVAHRKKQNDIMEQAVYQDLDVVFGGGGRYLVAGKADDRKASYEKGVEALPAKQWARKGKRKDGENLIRVLREKGYTLVSTRKELRRLTRGPVFGIFAAKHMAAEIDRPHIAPNQPSLAEMTRKAIALLAEDPQGFFLMVEGSQVDWACHANDPAHLVSDLLVFDEAVGVALDFAKTRGDTLLLVMPDHNTGGMSIGNWATSRTYSQMKPADLVGPLRRMKVSAPLLLKKMKGVRTPEKVMEVVRDFWDLRITRQDARTILDKMVLYGKKRAHYAFGEVLSPKYLAIGWSTHGHCGGDVPLGAFGPDRPCGLLDAPQVGKRMARALGVDLDAATRRLFVDPSKIFGASHVTLDTSDPENPVIRIRDRGRPFVLPVNKNLLQAGDRMEALEGVAVYIRQTKKAYIPQQAVELIQKSR